MGSEFGRSLFMLDPSEFGMARLSVPSWGNIAMLFLCHSVVRKDDCTSNYKVAEKSIAIFPQLGAIMIIIRYIFW